MKNAPFQRRTLDCGTTTACYFATIHKNASKILADRVHEMGQRAFIGKVAMNQNSPDTYVLVQGRFSCGLNDTNKFSF